MRKIVKKYLSQKCVGYSQDFERSYFESEVEYMDGTIGVEFSCTVRREDGTNYIEIIRALPGNMILNKAATNA